LRRTPPGVPCDPRTGLLPLVLGTAFSLSGTALAEGRKSPSSLSSSGSHHATSDVLTTPVKTSYLKVLWPMPPSRDPDTDRANASIAVEACKQFGHAFLLGHGLWGTGLFDEFGCFTSVGQKFFGGREPKSDPAWTLEFTQTQDRLIVRLMLASDKLTNSAAAALVAPAIEAGAVAFPAPPNWQYLMRDEFYSKLVAAAVLDTAPAATRLPLPATALRPEDANQLGKTAAPTALQLFTWGVQPETGLWTAHVVGVARIEGSDRVFDWVDRAGVTHDSVVYAQRRSGPEHGAQALLISIRHRGQTIIDGADEPRPGRLPGLSQLASLPLVQPSPQPSAQPAAMPPPQVASPSSGTDLALTEASAPPPREAPALVQPIAAPPIPQEQPIAPPPVEVAPIEAPAPVAEAAPIAPVPIEPMAAPMQAPMQAQAPQDEGPMRFAWENRPPRIATSESFVSLRYGFEMIDTATALFSPGTVVSFTGELHRGWLNGLRLYTDTWPEHKRDIEGEVFSINWSRYTVGWAYLYRLSGLIDRIEVIPKLGVWNINSRLPDIDADENIVTREYKASGLKNFGLEINGVIENASYLARLFHARDMTMLASKTADGAKHELQANRTGLELYIKGGPLRFISNSIKWNLLAFDYFEDLTINESGGTKSDLKFVYSTAFAGGGVSLSW